MFVIFVEFLAIKLVSVILLVALIRTSRKEKLNSRDIIFKASVIVTNHRVCHLEWHYGEIMIR